MVHYTILFYVVEAIESTKLLETKRNHFSVNGKFKMYT